MAHSTISVVLVVLLTALGISGCVSTQTVTERVGQRYVGKPLDEFVRKHGAPQQRVALSGGDVRHVWNDGGTMLVCEVELITSPAGTIKRVAILKDTIGIWTTSMCHEVFNE